MASKRELKKRINLMIYDVVDECFSIQLYNSKKTEVTDKFIDEAADFQDEIMAAIHKAKNKSEFRKIVEKVEDINEEWLERLNKLA
ncbi:MAG: hypothetical protein M9897_07815 [Brumimicrobium sp.]|nr:hypothetical protein [Brumimicrobium sp.]